MYRNQYYAQQYADYEQEEDTAAEPETEYVEYAEYEEYGMEVDDE